MGTTSLKRDLTRFDVFLSSFLMSYKIKRCLFENDIYIQKGGLFNSPRVIWKKRKDNGDTILTVTVKKIAVAKIDEKIENKLGRVLETLFDRELIDVRKKASKVEFDYLFKYEQEDSVNIFDVLNYEDLTEVNTLETWVRLNKHEVVNFSEDPSLIVVGGSGSGKTNYLFYLIRELLLYTTNRKNLYIADAKTSKLARVCRRLKLQVRTKPDDIYKMLEHVYKIFKSRENKREQDIKFPTFLIIDEYAAFKTYYSSKSATKEQKVMYSEIDRMIQQIASMGRERKVFLIIGNQRAEADIIGSNARFNYANRIGLGNFDTDSYNMLFTVPRFTDLERKVGEGVYEKNGKLKTFKTRYVETEGY